MAEIQKPRNAGKMAPATANTNSSAQMQAQVQNAAKQSLTSIMNSVLDSEGYRKRFEDLMGDRTPQFVSSIISIVNADEKLRSVFQYAPVSIIQAAHTAASYDLPIGPSLGFAYIVPFWNEKNKRFEAQFIRGYKGTIQLALRTGVYHKLNVVDIREGELISRDRLREDFEFCFIEDDAKRETTPIIGYAAYYRLNSGTEKILYMSNAQIEAHERVNRKGQSKGWGWMKFPDAMSRKTVLGQLLNKWGPLSIDYKKSDPAAANAMKALRDDLVDDLDVEPDSVDFDMDTGEVTGPPADVAGIKPPFE